MYQVRIRNQKCLSVVEAKDFNEVQFFLKQWYKTNGEPITVNISLLTENNTKE